MKGQFFKKDPLPPPPPPLPVIALLPISLLFMSVLYHWCSLSWGFCWEYSTRVLYLSTLSFLFVTLSNSSLLFILNSLLSLDHPAASIISLQLLLSLCSFYYLSAASIISLQLLLSPCSFYYLPAASIISLQLLLSPCSFYYLSATSIISLQLLLSPCSFYYLPAASIISLQLLLSPCSFYYLHMTIFGVCRVPSNPVTSPGGRNLHSTI